MTTRAAFTEFLHGATPATFRIGQRFVVDEIDYGAGGHSLARVWLTAEPEPVVQPAKVSKQMKLWLTAALKQFPYARSHPEYVTGHDEASIMKSAELVHRFGGGPEMQWVIPPESDIPALVESWRPPERPDPRFVAP